jgi:hypothetical protein
MPGQVSQAGGRGIFKPDAGGSLLGETPAKLNRPSSRKRLSIERRKNYG